MTKPSAKVVKDSISPYGTRLTTFEVCFNRFVLAEVNTHRVFSRNSASSRAIPVAKQIKKVEHDPALPVRWQAEQKGMQGGADLVERDALEAEDAWREAADDMVIRARRLAAVGVHKGITNRLLEPFQMHTAVITATAWSNFFEQRCSPLAQPEIQAVANLMRDAMEASTPEVVQDGFWHLPYVDRQTITAVEEHLLGQEGQGNYGKAMVTRYLVMVSAARCARVSYETQDGVRDIGKDLDLYDRLVSAQPWHGSPLEHVATPDPTNSTLASLAFTNLDGEAVYLERAIPLMGNLIGWRQHRTEVEAQLDLEPLR